MLFTPANEQLNRLSQQVILKLQELLAALGYKPKVHFELEGCFIPAFPGSRVDFSQLNNTLNKLGISGEIISEYWKNQWEFVSAFSGQTPLKEAQNLAQLIQILPELFKQHSIGKVLIKPVVWSGDRGKLAPDCHNIFSDDRRAVHIPNAIQMNVSLWEEKSNINMLTRGAFGERLQQVFIQQSRACSLLFLPEEEAFERFALKTRYGLENELCSPNDISGGHQGSVALYKKLGKHNQAMGLKTLLVDQHNNAIVSQQNWQETTRIEHRLGASSERYNPFINVIFALIGIIEALDKHVEAKDLSSSILAEKFMLPSSLYDNNALKCDANELGALSLFQKDTWFIKNINSALRRHGELALGVEQKESGLLWPKIKNGQKAELFSTDESRLGEQIHQLILSTYSTPSLVLN